eukprot:TRINITY_DN45_c0_g1_i10.p1 TRINITY_DN45_c0_g1~~TRINITY_DN45_c0_g1_i10.p1  ORF type:complete len:193 (+),score=31.73 TRINITY_DN45_c0_g1_i10:206-784(+)
MSCPHPCSSAPSPPPSPSPSPPPPPRGRLSTLRRSRSAARILVHSGARESPAISPPSRPRAPHWYFEDPEILSPLSHLRHGTCDYLNDLMDLRFLYDLELERLENAREKMQSFANEEDMDGVVHMLSIIKRVKQRVRNLVYTMQDLQEEKAKKESELERERRSKRKTKRSQSADSGTSTMAAYRHERSTRSG